MGCIHMKYSAYNYWKVRAKLPPRDKNAHKGNVGKILLLCGSKGFTGAAALSALGALRVGAGLVYLGVPSSIYEIEATKLNEPIIFPLEDKDGMLAEESVETISQYLEKVDVVLVGPGIGLGEGTQKVVKYVLEKFYGPVVLDADGITLVSAHKNVLRDRTGQTVITPHGGEFYRLMGKKPLDRCKSAVEMAQTFGCVTVLKGHHTVITDGIHGFINKTGNPGMAVGGSGDVLAGMIAGLIGQGLSPVDAAACGAWLHGAAGDICARKMGQYSMLPSDLLQVLPRLMK